MEYFVDIETRKIRKLGIGFIFHVGAFLKREIQNIESRWVKF